MSVTFTQSKVTKGKEIYKKRKTSHVLFLKQIVSAGLNPHQKNKPNAIPGNGHEIN